jgi:hypothetical protein
MLISIKNTSCSIFLVLGSMLFISSCTEKSKKDNVIKALGKNLIVSNNVINISTTTNMKALYDKSVDFCTEERAKTWLPKAQIVIDNTKKLYAEIEKYIDVENIKRGMNFDNTVLKSIILQLNNYKQILLNSDSSIMEEFANNFDFIDRFIMLTNNLKSQLNNKSVSSLLTLLMNDIKIIENKIITFCNSKVGCNIFIFDSYSSIVGQNSNYLKPGSELTIQAGIGAYNKSSLPQITINGKKAELGVEGYSIYKMKVSKKPGNYIVPVHIKYMNRIIGKEETSNINVEYTVVKPCDQ